MTVTAGDLQAARDRSKAATADHYALAQSVYALLVQAVREGMDKDAAIEASGIPRRNAILELTKHGLNL